MWSKKEIEQVKAIVNALKKVASALKILVKALNDYVESAPPGLKYIREEFMGGTISAAQSYQERINSQISGFETKVKENERALQHYERTVFERDRNDDYSFDTE